MFDEGSFGPFFFLICFPAKDSQNLPRKKRKEKAGETESDKRGYFAVVLVFVCVPKAQ